jgi:hypothetical protein
MHSQSNGISCLPRRRRSKAYQRRADMCCRVIGQGCARCDELDSLFAQLTRRVEIVRLGAGGRQSPTSSQVRGRRAAPAKSRHWVGRPRRLCDSASARRGRGEWPGWLTASNGWRQLGVKPRCPTAIWPALGGTCALDVGFPSLGLLASWGQWHGRGGFGESLFNCKGRRTKRIGQPHRVDVYASPSTPCHSLPKINSSSTDGLYEKRRRHHRFQAGNAEFMLIPKRREADCTSGQSTASAVVRGFRLIPTWTWTCMF